MNNKISKPLAAFCAHAVVLSFGLFSVFICTVGIPLVLYVRTKHYFAAITCELISVLLNASSETPLIFSSDNSGGLPDLVPAQPNLLRGISHCTLKRSTRISPQMEHFFEMLLFSYYCIRHPYFNTRFSAYTSTKKPSRKSSNPSQ
jgi:hypothetical protein